MKKGIEESRDIIERRIDPDVISWVLLSMCAGLLSLIFYIVDSPLLTASHFLTGLFAAITLVIYRGSIKGRTDEK